MNTETVKKKKDYRVREKGLYIQKTYENCLMQEH